jgi:hypothetical protein
MSFFTFGNYKGTDVLMWSSELEYFNQRGGKAQLRLSAFEYAMSSRRRSRRAGLWWTRGEGAVGQGLEAAEGAYLKGQAVRGSITSWKGDVS